MNENKMSSKMDDNNLMEHPTSEESELDNAWKQFLIEFDKDIIIQEKRLLEFEKKVENYIHKVESIKQQLVLVFTNDVSDIILDYVGTIPLKPEL